MQTQCGMHTSSQAAAFCCFTMSSLTTFHLPGNMNAFEATDLSLMRDVDICFAAPMSTVSEGVLFDATLACRLQTSTFALSS